MSWGFTLIFPSCAGEQRDLTGNTWTLIHILALRYQATSHYWNCCWPKLWPWWRHQMETFSALLAICDVYFDLRPNKRLSKQWWGWWFEMTSRPLWHNCNEPCGLTGPQWVQTSENGRYFTGIRYRIFLNEHYYRYTQIALFALLAIKWQHVVIG